MQTYYERQSAKIERLKRRIAKNKTIASENDLSLYGEAKSGIPMGQPILIGHHSERKHRKHLERIEKKVRSGYEAQKKAEYLESRLESIESRKAIDSDNPNALELVQFKIAKLEEEKARNRAINIFIKSACMSENPIDELASSLTILDSNLYPKSSARFEAEKLLKPGFNGRIQGIPAWWFTNTNAEIRRLKKRIAELESLSSGWEPITFQFGKVEIIEGRVVIEFKDYHLNQIVISLIKEGLKKSPFVFKFSPSTKCWVRKHTATTQSSYFRKQLEDYLKGFEDGRE